MNEIFMIAILAALTIFYFHQAMKYLRQSSKLRIALIEISFTEITGGKLEDARKIAMEALESNRI